MLRFDEENDQQLVSATCGVLLSPQLPSLPKPTIAMSSLTSAVAVSDASSLDCLSILAIRRFCRLSYASRCEVWVDEHCSDAMYWSGLLRSTVLADCRKS